MVRKPLLIGKQTSTYLLVNPCYIKLYEGLKALKAFKRLKIEKSFFLIFDTYESWNSSLIKIRPQFHQTAHQQKSVQNTKYNRAELVFVRYGIEHAQEASF